MNDSQKHKEKKRKFSGKNYLKIRNAGGAPEAFKAQPANLSLMRSLEARCKAYSARITPPHRRAGGACRRTNCSTWSGGRCHSAEFSHIGRQKKIPASLPEAGIVFRRFV
jgi:hypothetical protein